MAEVLGLAMEPRQLVVLVALVAVGLLAALVLLASRIQAALVALAIPRHRLEFSLMAEMATEQAHHMALVLLVDSMVWVQH